MKHKSVGNKLAGTTTIVTVPAGEKIKLVSLYLSNVDGVNPASADVYILKGGVGPNIYLIKDALIPIQAVLQVVSNEVILEQNDSLVINPSHPDRVDSFLSYYEIKIFDGMYD